MPSAEMITPKKETSETQNRHLTLLNVMPARASRGSLEPFIMFLLGASNNDNVVDHVGHAILTFQGSDHLLLKVLRR